MPTPYGTRGGMAFAAAELRVLRRALALALHPDSATVQDVQDCHRLAESLDDAAREGARFRDFLLADLARYRAALPGGARGYLALLGDALDAGYRPDPDDFAALRGLGGVAGVLLARCRGVLEESMNVQAAERAAVPAARSGRAGAGVRRPLVPGSRRRLMALPGGLSAEPGEPQEPEESPEAEPAPEEPTAAPEPEREEQPEREEGKPEPEPEPGKRAEPSPPGRHVPTPAEVFPPKRKPAPPADPAEQLAAG